MRVVGSLRSLGFLIPVVLIFAIAWQIGFFDSDESRSTFRDRDKDAFSDALEDYVGTDPRDDCPDDRSDSAWPPDLDNDGLVTDADLDAVATGGGNTARSRRDIAPDPPDGNIDVTDVGRIAGLYGKAC